VHLRGELGRSAVLVDCADEKHLVSLHPPKPSMHVRRQHRACKIAKMLDAVDVRQGGCDQVTARHCLFFGGRGEYRRQSSRTLRSRSSHIGPEITTPAYRQRLQVSAALRYGRMEVRADLVPLVHGGVPRIHDYSNEETCSPFPPPPATSISLASLFAIASAKELKSWTTIRKALGPPITFCR